jgi:hypothetical protein
MTVTLIIRGGEIELHESEQFNKVRHRLNRARKLSEDYKNGTIGGAKSSDNDQKFDPFHLLTFRTADDGRFCGDIENVIGALSDEPRDGGSGSDDEDEE